MKEKQEVMEEQEAEWRKTEKIGNKSKCFAD